MAQQLSALAALAQDGFVFCYPHSDSQLFVTPDTWVLMSFYCPQATLTSMWVNCSSIQNNNK